MSIVNLILGECPKFVKQVFALNRPPVRALYVRLIAILPLVLLGTIAFGQSVKTITLSQDAIEGTGSVTCTVTFPFHFNALTLSVKSSNPFVTVPSSLTVGPLVLSVQFTVTVGQLHQASEAYIAVSTDNNLQAAHLYCYLQPSDLAPSATLTVGTNANMITWSGLGYDAFGTDLAGYRVLRSSDGVNYVALNSLPTTGDAYLDTTCVAGTSYSYEVALVSGTGTVLSTSNILSGASSSGAYLQWEAPPSNSTPLSASTAISCVPSPSSNVETASGYVFVDGLLVGTCSSAPESPDSQDGSAVQYLAGAIDPMLVSFSNSHSVVMTEGTSSGFLTTGPAEFTVDTNWASGHSDDLVELNSGQYARFKAVYSGPSTGLTYSSQVEVLDGSGNVVRHWTTTNATDDFYWDGTDDSGSPVDVGSYQIETADGKFAEFVNVVDPYPQVLVLVRDLYPSDPERGYAEFLAHGFKYTCAQTSGLSLAVLYTPDGLLASDRQMVEIKRWLSQSVTVFYAYCHGNPGELLWGGHYLYNHEAMEIGRPDLDKKSVDLEKIGNDRRSLGLPYWFVYLDGCNTAGKNGAGGWGWQSGLYPGNDVDYSFLLCFPLPEYSTYNCFIGNNGAGLGSHWLDVPTHWDVFRRTLFSELWQGHDLQYAFQQALIDDEYYGDSVTIDPGDASPDHTEIRFFHYGGYEGPPFSG